MSHRRSASRPAPASDRPARDGHAPANRALRPLILILAGLTMVPASSLPAATSPAITRTQDGTLPAAPTAPPPPPASRAAADDRVPATLSGIGLEVRFPPGTTVSSRETPNGPAITALDGGSPPRWSILVQPIPASVSPPVARTQLEAIIDTQRSPAGPLEPRVEQRAVAGGVLGHLAILRDPADRPDPYLGLAVFPRATEGRGMVLVSARGTDEAVLLQVMRDLLASVELRGTRDISNERGERLERGTAVLASLDRRVLQSLLGRQQWYRTYRRTEEGREEEVGCMLVEVTEGLRGMVDPNRPSQRYSMAEREPGFLVRVAARFPVSQGVVRSSQAIHWMAWDQSAEQWSVRATMRDGRRTSSEALTGIRAPRTAGNPRGSIHLVTARERGVTDPPAFWDVPAVFLSQPIRWLLGDLLVAADIAPGVQAWYSIDASDGRPDLTYREDRWRRDPEGTGWILETRPNPTSTPIVSRYDSEGQLQLRVTPEGIRTEPISLPDLRRLWASKGLPTGPLTADR